MMPIKTVSALILIGVTMQIATAMDALDDRSRMFLKSHCLECHNDQKQEGKFRLDNLSPDFTDPQAAQKWAEVVFRINAEMPRKIQLSHRPKSWAGCQILTEKIRDSAAARMGDVASCSTPFEPPGVRPHHLRPARRGLRCRGTRRSMKTRVGWIRPYAPAPTAPSHIDRYFQAANTVVQLAFPDNEPKPQKNGERPARERISPATKKVGVR